MKKSGASGSATMDQRDGESAFVNTGFANIDAAARPTLLVSQQDRVNAVAAIQAY